MESYGNLLKKTRELKGLDIETASYDTSISLPYLHGLEEEEEGVFPGEPYMLGFLRTYSEYLGLNPNTVFALYHAKKVQESPIPQGLIVHEKPKIFYPLIVTLILLLLTGATLTIIYFVKKHNEIKRQESILLDEKLTTKTYELTEKVFTGRVYVGDQFIFHSDKGDVVLTVKDTLGAFALQCPIGVLYTELAEDQELDIDGDNLTDLIVYLSDISQLDAERGAEVRIIKKSGINYADIPNLTTDKEATKHKMQVIFEDNRAYPFTININFRGSALFRYKIDRKESVESYYTMGEVITMTASNGMRLWMSNCNCLKISVIADSKNYDLAIGKAGQVLVEDIKWVKDTDGKYKIVVLELD